jgi:sensor domain CHASE-containing protein
VTPDRWLTLLGIAVAILGICVPVLVTVMLRRDDRQRAETLRLKAVIDKQEETIEKQRETIIDYKIAQRELGGVSESVRRLFSALPVKPQDGSET